MLGLSFAAYPDKHARAAARDNFNALVCECFEDWL
jgi:hypothetical protein